MRRLLALLLTLAAVGAGAGFHAEAARAGDDNLAVAVNTKDGASIFKLAFSIRKAAGEVVDNTNAAVAYSSCTECSTTAIAIQIVLVTGDPDTVTPTNLAVAVNENCTLCQTFATAYQIVLTTDGPVRLSGEGRRRIAEIVKELRELKKAGLGPAELDARIDALVDDLKDVLATELVPKKPGDEESEELDEQETSTTTTTTPVTGATTAGGEQTVTTTSPATDTATTTTTPSTTTTTTTPTSTTTTTTTTEP